MIRKPFNLILFLLIAPLFHGCASLFNTSSLKIEVIQPSFDIVLPKNYRKVAVRYNNVNVSQNPENLHYKYMGKPVSDMENLDSIASEIYFAYFLDGIRLQDFFDSVIELEPGSFSRSTVKDTLSFYQLSEIDTTAPPDTYAGYVNSYILSNYLKSYPVAQKSNSETETMLDPKFGFYTSQELQTIADTTGADLLLSLDHFYVRNEIDTTGYALNHNFNVFELAEINAFWSIYDLSKNIYKYYYLHQNALYWNGESSFIKNVMKVVPPSRDAVLNSADVHGTEFSKMLIPHWEEVERMYYKSGHVDLKQTEDLINEGKWLEAAKLWKKNIDNPNKRIAAKCMYNMGLACEMEGDMDAAIDWVVKSYHVFGEENEIHATNCKNYLGILGTRKLDFKILDKQMPVVEQQ
ncbi:MAG: DUF6340 family protein [Draconibacterium sp.]